MQNPLAIPAACCRARPGSCSTCRTGSERAIGITRLHLEQDAGKSLHDHIRGDLCRFEPSRDRADGDHSPSPISRSAEEAGLYLRKLRSILLSGTCRRQHGGGSSPVRGAASGQECEVKNVNSCSFVTQAINCARRQIAADRGGQCGRTADPAVGPLPRRDPADAVRSKENAHDYRYFPDPTCCSELDPEWVDRLRAELPELPEREQTLSPSTVCGRRTPTCWSPSARPRSISKKLRRTESSELGHQQSVRA